MGHMAPFVFQQTPLSLPLRVEVAVVLHGIGGDLELVGHRGGRWGPTDILEAGGRM